MGRNLIFSIGALIVGLGAFDLYVGLSQTGLGEAAFISISQSFMLLFPGSVFIAYALQHKPRLSATCLDAEVGSVPVAADVPLSSGDNVIVAFPERRGSRFGGKSGGWSHSK
jgi:hypothetical protein